MNWNVSGFGKRRSLKNARFSFLLPFVAFPLLHRDLSPSGPKSWARGIRPLLGTSPWFNLMSSIFHFEQKLRFLTRYNSPILAKVWGMCRSRDLRKSVRQRRACDESIHPAPRDGARASRTWKVTLVPPHPPSHGGRGFPGPSSNVHTRFLLSTSKRSTSGLSRPLTGHVADQSETRASLSIQAPRPRALLCAKTPCPVHAASLFVDLSA